MPRQVMPLMEIAKHIAEALPPDELDWLIQCYEDGCETLLACLKHYLDGRPIGTHWTETVK